jgi:hypothetical protein
VQRAVEVVEVLAVARQPGELVAHVGARVVDGAAEADHEGACRDPTGSRSELVLERALIAAQAQHLRDAREHGEALLVLLVHALLKTSSGRLDLVHRGRPARGVVFFSLKLRSPSSPPLNER